MKITDPIEQNGSGIIPKWARVPDAITFSGLSRTKLYNLANEGKITSVSLREQNQIKATRLFCLKSIDDYISSFISKDMEVGQ